jgi:nucleotide-binding universal stress UspA family protein
MTYATVMVCLDLDKPNEARLQLAGDLAERFGAAIIGIAAAQSVPPMYFADGAFAQDVIDQAQGAVTKRLAGLEDQFRDRVGHRSERIEWRSAIDFPARFILQEARCADIIVSGRQGSALSDAFALASPRDLVMQAGRPLLVAPDGVSWLDIRSILVAWKDTAEARRAVADSLPMLRKAKEVTVTEILERGCDHADAATRVKDVAAWLSRHGVSAVERVSENADGNAAAQLDVMAGAAGAGLIVAGAYGHSRFRELVLGGMTQHLLTQTTRCVLLSH